MAVTSGIIRRVLARAACPFVLGPALVPVLVLAAAVAADEKAARDPDLPWLDNEFYKVNVEVRPRIELADQDNLDASQAYTIRSHVGLRAKPYYGFSALAELLNIWSLDDGSYHDGASTPNGDTTIADPEQTKLNRAWLQFERPQWWGAKAKGGRQRILFDDQRFVGNIGWRQGEQSFDAALGETSLGVDDLTIQYAYLWDIRRIFGDQGPRSVGARDWDSDSHLVRVHYTGFGSSDGSSSLKLSAFAYLLDFQGDAPANSSNSYGFRLAGQRDLGDDWTLKYVGSYAFQTDANDNPADYDAHYVWVSGDVGPKELGTLGVGYELLGSDGGDARFVTPLATAHKFNGFADVFLNNGGVRGLQDLNFTLAPKLPWKLSGKLIYHEFWSDHRNKHRGREIDGVLSRPINPYMTALTKFAYFDGSSSGPDDIYRVWFQLTFAY